MMHRRPEDFELVTATSLTDALERLSTEPGRYTPIAGGTELMVAFNTGRLATRSLLSLHAVCELRYVSVAENAVHLGAGATFTDIRQHAELARGWPLLPRAASWTGAVANQNRATLGGNMVNASPAADTPPVLLAYDAAITLISKAGQRTLPYRDFHLGYKKIALQPDELVLEVVVPRVAEGTQQYLRKVGARNAQAISKVAMAAAAQTDGTRIQHIRLGAASLGDRPLRLRATEAALLTASLAPADFERTIRQARAALATESKPIDDIRSTAQYRTAVAQNLLEEFLRSLVA